MVKIDLHCHSYYSKDSFFSPEELIGAFLKKGLDGIALTEQETIAGRKEVVKAAKKLNSILILGQEIKAKRKKLLAIFWLFL